MVSAPLRIRASEEVHSNSIRMEQLIVWRANQAYKTMPEMTTKQTIKTVSTIIKRPLGFQAQQRLLLQRPGLRLVVGAGRAQCVPIRGKRSTMGLERDTCQEATNTRQHTMRSE